MAELHIIGQVSSAQNFKQLRLLCKWSFYAGNGWKIISGDEEGQTQESCDIYTNEPIWDHPVDLHYTTKTLQNSPKLLLQVFCRDNYGRVLFLSYGVYNVPLSPGSHTLECHTWRPIGNWKDRLQSRFLGRSLQLKSPSVLINTVDRFDLLTQSMGTVIVRLHILARHFDKFGSTFLPLLLFLTYADVAYATKIEDILTCLNDTDCDESIDDSALHTPNSEVDDSASRDASNYTEEDGLYVTTASMEITTSSKMNTSVTERPQSTAATTTSPATTVTPRDDETILTLEKKEICECDLTRSACDVNCCCDADCSQFHLPAFSHCQDHRVELYDSRYCYHRNFIQRNNTPFILEKLANNLFCVLYDNLPSTYTVDNEVLQSENDLWKTIQSRRYRWKVENAKALPKYNLSKPYQHGDILWKLHDDSVEPIELLQSGFTGICSFRKTVRYLEDWRGACVQKELTNDNPYLFPAAFDNITVISSLPSFNETFVAKQTCRSNVCLPVRNHYCLNSFSVCNWTKLPGFCLANSTCVNIVKGVKYIISHNGSAGISRVDAYFNIGNASETFHQHYEVRYEWKDSNKTRVFVRSGNPGYVAGKPIIVGASRVNVSGIFFNSTDAFLTLPSAGKNGECDRIDRHIVAFGEDAKLRCSIKLPTKNFTALSCVELQNLTMRFLLKDSSLNASQRYDVYASKLGNFSSNNTADWLRIVLDRSPRNVVTARVVGKRILCSGLVTSLHLDVLYAALSKPKTLTNYKILGIGVTFSKEEDVSWPKCRLENCTDILHVDVLSYVSFHDVTKPSRYYFVGGPNLDITLPYDFFYPFLNASERTEISNTLILLIVYLVVRSISHT